MWKSTNTRRLLPRNQRDRDGLFAQRAGTGAAWSALGGRIFSPGDLSGATGEVRGEQLDDVPTEFPRMNDRWLGRPARYCYNPRLAPSSAVCFDGWIKYDLERGRSWVHALPADRVGDEAVFAPRPGASEEDDGYLVSFVHDRGGGPSRCVVIDARTMEERASLELPQRIPTGFHATWIPGGELPA